MRPKKPKRMIHAFTANVHYKECQIQPTTGQGCCQTFKDYPVFYQTSLVLLAYEETGVTLNSAFSQIRLAWVSLLPVLRGEIFRNWNPGFSCSVTCMILLLDPRDCETYSILRIGCCVSASKSTRTTVLCLF